MNKNLLKKSRSLGSYRTRLITGLVFFLLSVSTLYAQTQVSGRILSGEDASPLPGVNVLVKGTTSGTISDADGKYILDVPSTNVTLVFSFVGYITQEVVLDGKTSVDMTLPTDATQLTEIVVTALGIEKDKSQLGYAVQDVKGQDIIKRVTLIRLITWRVKLQDLQ
jgi:hypothetical protein